MILLGTGFLFGLFSERDKHHDRALAVLESHRGRRLADFVLTTNHVVSETITMIRKKSHPDPGIRHDKAVKAGGKLFAGAFGRIHQVTAEQERTAFAYFSRHRDKKYSFADCVSFVVMEELGIEVAWSVDGDFDHRFKAVPGPLPK